MLYKIIEDFTATGLSLKINDLINKGWQPLGGISVTHVSEKDTDNHQFLFAHAMISTGSNRL